VNPRYAVAIGATFLIVATVYWLAPYFFGGHVDYAGITMLFVLSIAMTLLFYLLIASTPRSE
jgi:hypothetical protein